jgi:hypothetical protein
VRRWIAIVFVAGLSGCPDSASSVPDAGDLPGPQGEPATADLVINEVSPRPGAGPDWLEIVNRSGQPIDLCAFFLTDAVDRLDHYLPLGGVAPPDPCTPRWLEPWVYHVVWADDAATAGLDHAPFELGVADEVNLLTTTGLGVDSVVYLFPAGSEGRSLARAPDADGRFSLSMPTRGQPNLRPSEGEP